MELPPGFSAILTVLATEPSIKQMSEVKAASAGYADPNPIKACGGLRNPQTFGGNGFCWSKEQNPLTRVIVLSSSRFAQGFLRPDISLRVASLQLNVKRSEAFYFP